MVRGAERTRARETRGVAPLIMLRSRGDFDSKLPLQATREVGVSPDDGASTRPATTRPPTQEARTMLQELLGKSFETLAESLREMDRSGTGVVDKSEFIRAFTPSIRTGSSVDGDALALLFDELDRDCSGSLDLEELKRVQRDRGPNEVTVAGGATRNSAGFKGALPQVRIDENSDISITQQLRDFLSLNKGRAIDLFRSWDEDEGGTIERDEFHKAMSQLGVTAHKAVVDHLFDSFDLDHSGYIEYTELDKILRSKTIDIWMDHSLAPSSVPTPMRLERVHKVRQSRILLMCEELGYPDHPSIGEFLHHQQPTAYYMTPQEARVESLLHLRLPLPANTSPRPFTHMGPPTPAAVSYGSIGMIPTPRRPRPTIPPGPRVGISLEPDGGGEAGLLANERWKRQVQDHYERWEGKQHDLMRCRDQEFCSRRPWHAETQWPLPQQPQQPQQSLLHLQRHEQHLEWAARSPRRRGAQEISNIQSCQQPIHQQQPFPSISMLPTSPRSFPDPFAAERAKLEAQAADISRDMRATATIQPLGGRRHPPPVLPVATALLETSTRFTSLQGATNDDGKQMMRGELSVERAETSSPSAQTARSRVSPPGRRSSPRNKAASPRIAHPETPLSSTAMAPPPSTPMLPTTSVMVPTLPPASMMASVTYLPMPPNLTSKTPGTPGFARRIQTPVGFHTPLSF